MNNNLEINSKVIINSGKYKNKIGIIKIINEDKVYIKSDNKFLSLLGLLECNINDIEILQEDLIKSFLKDLKQRKNIELKLQDGNKIKVHEIEVELLLKGIPKLNKNNGEKFINTLLKSKKDYQKSIDFISKKIID